MATKINQNAHSSPQTVKNKNNFNIRVTYGAHSKLFSCSSRMEFGKKVSEFFGIEKSEMQFFEMLQNSRKPITINDLKDKMKVEVRKSGVARKSKPNEEETELLGSESAIDVPDVNELKRKLKENRVLTGIERQFVIHLIDNFPDNPSLTSKKRRRTDDNENDNPVQKVNKKVQVDIGRGKTHSSYTQTDAPLFSQSTKPSTCKDLISESKRLARSEKKDKDKVRKLMNETFEERRNFIILKNPVVLIVKEKYPLLFSTEETLNELNRIFYDKKDEEFLSNIRNYSSAILCCGEEDTLSETINRAIDAAITNQQKSYAKQVGAVLTISNIVKEKRTYLHTEDEPCKKDHFPRIEAPCTVSKLFEDVITYRIIVEGLTLCEASTFPEAVLCLMAAYFIFNITYPDEAFKTFVIMEKIFLDANDTEMNDIEEDTSQILRLIKLKANAKS